MEGREKGGRGKEGGEQAGLWSYGQGAADQVSWPGREQKTFGGLIDSDLVR